MQAFYEKLYLILTLCLFCGKINLYNYDQLKTKGGEEPTKGDINLAFELINHRLMNSGYITIISSEKSLRELGAFDEGTMSRIYQCTGQYKITIGADKRKNFRIVH